jgi:actin-related protein
MKIIAFKRAKDHPSLHPDFIVEYIDADLLPSLDGYESMTEDNFSQELAQNDSRMAQKLADIEKQRKTDEQMKIDEKSAEIVQERENEREFEEFKRWKKRGKK